MEDVCTQQCSGVAVVALSEEEMVGGFQMTKKIAKVMTGKDSKKG